jgi:hypothetical protein
MIKIIEIILGVLLLGISLFDKCSQHEADKQAKQEQDSRTEERRRLQDEAIEDCRSSPRYRCSITSHEGRREVVGSFFKPIGSCNKQPVFTTKDGREVPVIGYTPLTNDRLKVNVAFRGKERRSTVVRCTSW